jgi:hypothetical protein
MNGAEQYRRIQKLLEGTDAEMDDVWEITPTQMQYIPSNYQGIGFIRESMSDRAIDDAIRDLNENTLRFPPRAFVWEQQLEDLHTVKQERYLMKTYDIDGDMLSALRDGEGL